MRMVWCAGLGAALLAWALFVSMEARPQSLAGTEASVVVYRLGGANLGSLSAVVEVNGSQVARLRRKSYTEIRLPNGLHLLSARALGYAGHADLEINIEQPGRVFYEVEPNARRPGLFAAPIPVVGEAAAIAEAAAAHPFLFKVRSEEEFQRVRPGLRLLDASR